MARLRKNQPPTYRLHKQSGQAIVTLCGQDHLLGLYNSVASKREYDRLITTWIANGRRPLTSAGDITVAELIKAFRAHAETYYRMPDGSAGSEAMAYREALRPLRMLFAATPAQQFGPLALKTVRQRMIEIGWTRRNINRQVSRIRHLFKWATENELLPPAIYQALQAVSGLRAGRCEAKESSPVRPVPEATIEQTLPYLPPIVQAMVRFQLITGARPGEVCAMRTADIDTSVQPWTYRPPHHKTLHHGHERIIYIGKKAQAIIKPYLRRDLTAFLFQPAEVDAWSRQQRHNARKTPLGQGNQPGSNRKRRPARKPGERYDATSYCRAIARACEQAFQMPTHLRDPRPGTRAARDDTPELKAQRQAKRKKWRAAHCWHPNQLRHTAATNLRRDYGLEAAQVILGHRTLTITQVYAEKNVEAAKRIVGEVG